MSFLWPWTFSKDEPAGPELENRLQDNFDFLAGKFPVNGGNIANDVPRLAVTHLRRTIVAGTVNADGTTAVGEGFTATRTAVGKYTVTFNAELASIPAITVSALPTGTNATNNASVPTRTTTGFTVQTTDPASAGFQDIEFDFFAFG